MWVIRMRSPSSRIQIVRATQIHAVNPVVFFKSTIFLHKWMGVQTGFDPDLSVEWYPYKVDICHPYSQGYPPSSYSF